jgi:hypothetical protein
MSEDNAGNVRTVYAELCSSYHQIDDFRSKLLGFLPLATGGVFLFASDSGRNILDDWELSLVIGLFGLFITLGLFIFEIYGIRKCTNLIALGQILEEELGTEGQFTNRPDGLHGAGITANENEEEPKATGNSSLLHYSQYISEPLAAGVIYPAVAAAWLFLASRLCFVQAIAAALAVSIFLAGLVFSCWYLQWLHHDTDRLKKEIVKRMRPPENTGN